MYVYVYHDNDNRVTILSQIYLTRVCVGGGGGQREDKKGYGAIRFLKPVLYLWKRRCPHGVSVWKCLWANRNTGVQGEQLSIELSVMWRPLAWERDGWPPVFKLFSENIWS